MEQLLIVEDDLTLNEGLCKVLRNERIRTVSCRNLREAREQLALGNVSLVLLDLHLPDGNGSELLREIRERDPNLPVILLTANDTDADIVQGLEQGADDYITKPFSLSVLRARVNARLRASSAKKESDVYRSGSFSFDFSRMTYSVNGISVELSKTEQRLLRILVEHSGRTVRREDLIDRIWTDGSEYVDENALSVTVKRLRDKLSAQEAIKTVYGIGYRWVNPNG